MYFAVCEQRLGMESGHISWLQITSDGNGFFPSSTGFRLFWDPVFTPDTSLSSPDISYGYVEVDLIDSHTITGVMMQGLHDGDEMWVEYFQLDYERIKLIGGWNTYKTIEGQPKVFLKWHNVVVALSL